MLSVHMDAKREQDGGEKKRALSHTGFKGLRQVQIHSLCSQELSLWRLKIFSSENNKYYMIWIF